MKINYCLWLIMFLNIFSSCTPDGDGCDTVEIYPVNNISVELYPYHNEDTVRFLYNHSDTLVFARMPLQREWTYLPTDPTICPKKFETVSYKYLCIDCPFSLKISASAYITYETYKYFWGNEYIGPKRIYLSAADSTIINGHSYKNLSFYTNSEDTSQYFLLQGRRVIKIKYSDNFFTLIK